MFNLADICDIIHKESIRFRATTKEQLIQKINCSECDFFLIVPRYGTLVTDYIGIVSFQSIKKERV